MKWRIGLALRGALRGTGAWPTVPHSLSPDGVRAQLRAAVEWLLRSQRGTEDDGSSACYSLRTGWAPSFPETTGYLIDTLVAAAPWAARPDLCRDAARRMAEWLCEVQLETGAWPGGVMGDLTGPSVFNTGQVLGGMVTAYQAYGDSRFLEAGRRAGEWLCEVQSPDGSWGRHIYCNSPRTYYTRVGWSLLRLAGVRGLDSGERYRTAGLRHCQWAVANQLPNGFFRDCRFSGTGDDPSNPITHTIAYAIEGLLETGALLGDAGMVAAAECAAATFEAHFMRTGSLPAEWDDRWRPRSTYLCLTGCAQMALVWARLAELGHGPHYLLAARLLNGCLADVAPTDGGPAEVHGALAGSYPLWGAYGPFAYPNWATKFYADALMAEARLVGEEAGACGLRP